jgi:hypothetical protein
MVLLQLSTALIKILFLLKPAIKFVPSTGLAFSNMYFISVRLSAAGMFRRSRSGTGFPWNIFLWSLGRTTFWWPG